MTDKNNNTQTTTEPDTKCPFCKKDIQFQCLCEVVGQYTFLPHHEQMVWLKQKYDVMEWRRERVQKRRNELAAVIRAQERRLCEIHETPYWGALDEALKKAEEILARREAMVKEADKRRKRRGF